MCKLGSDTDSRGRGKVAGLGNGGEQESKERELCRAKTQHPELGSFALSQITNAADHVHTFSSSSSGQKAGERTALTTT